MTASPLPRFPRGPVPPPRRCRRAVGSWHRLPAPKAGLLQAAACHREQNRDGQKKKPVKALLHAQVFESSSWQRNTWAEQLPALLHVQTKPTPNIPVATAHSTPLGRSQPCISRLAGHTLL